MKRDRTAAALTVAAGPNNSRAIDGYDAYFGRYTVDDAAGKVTQILDGALAPENIGMIVTRRMDVHRDELVIRLDTTAVDGTPIVRTLTWRRVG